MLVVKYSCKDCGIDRQPVLTTPRAEGQDIISFVGSVAASCRNDHEKRSPGCKPQTFSEIMIPAPDGAPIGSVNTH